MAGLTPPHASPEPATSSARTDGGGESSNRHGLIALRDTMNSAQQTALVARLPPADPAQLRVARVAQGSGRAPKEISELVKRFGQMRDMMAALGSKGGLLSKIPGLGRFAGAGAGAGGGLGGLDPSALLAGPMGGGSAARGPRRNPKSDKRKRKQAKKDRRKGRRR